jgi:hypothetical protein
MEKEIIEFACDIKLIRDLINNFSEGANVTKLNYNTILVKMNIKYEKEFMKWAKANCDTYFITIVEPARLRGKLPQ